MARSLLQGPWLPLFGGVTALASDQLDVTTGVPVVPTHGRFHAEARHERVLGADFAYSATIAADWTRQDLQAHLQFRISDEGRYGVRLVHGQVEFYRFALEPRQCAGDESVIAHCPLWPEGSDDPIETVLGAPGQFGTAPGSISLLIVARGSTFTVSFGRPGHAGGRLEVSDDTFGAGRFGVYAIANSPDLSVLFREVIATTDPTAESNFALLYNTVGYDLDGTKRALVRTLNDIDPADIDAAASTFTVTNAAGHAAVASRGFEAAQVAGSPAILRRTLGFQFLAAEFSDLDEPGRYTLEARIQTSTGERVLRSAPFAVERQLVTRQLLWPLTVLNAKARRAADDDYRRNWFAETGRDKWSVGLDGAFVADRANDLSGAVLRRIFNCTNRPLAEKNFRYTARITIVAGCDAQLQFRVTERERWAVTLQAGAAGGCSHGEGPGAVRLHREGVTPQGQSIFEGVEAHLLERPFVLGRAYDVDIRAIDRTIDVLLDGLRVIHFTRADNPQPGAFALKAWGSTVRFGHVKIWVPSVGLSRRFPGVWIPFDRSTMQSSQGFDIDLPDFFSGDEPPDDVNNLRVPKAAQQHGFHDCNTFMGEVTSHGVFLTGLMEVWATRAHLAPPAQQEELRRAIVTAVLYLIELSEQGIRSGAFAHQEPGRAALARADKVLATRFAVYGLSAFAEKGAAVDRKLTRTALTLATRAWRWLNRNDGRDLFLDSIAGVRLTRAAMREGTSSGFWLQLARTAAADVLNILSAPGRLAAEIRPTLRSIPWFEGIYEGFVNGPLAISDHQRDQVAEIARQLTALMNDPANGFNVIPQGDSRRQPPDVGLITRNWEDLASLPLADKPIPIPDPAATPPRHAVGDWYISEHFATAAADCVYIGRLAGDRALERLAAGNLHWMLGLNPGLPATKVVSPPTRGPWSASSFVYNGPGAFARTIEGNRIQENAAKGWLAPWELQPPPRPKTSSRHREMWAFDPGNTGFCTIVNGHVLREQQWHYWSIGPAGWVCGETFMLIDGSFVKAALALEDWHGGSTTVRDVPYDLTRPRFFDTTHFDRAATPWRFDDPDHTPAAQAWRMATDFAGGKSFGAGRPTGHFVGEHVGVLCLPPSATRFVDVPSTTIQGVAFPFLDINETHWAQVGRAAMEVARLEHAVAGMFTGHVLNDRCGWIGLDPRLVHVFNLADDDPAVTRSQWDFTDINAVSWAWAARLATDVCVEMGFAGGFFSGHHLHGTRQVIAIRHALVEP